MKDLKDMLNENILESIKKLSVTAYNLPDIIEFAATFDPNTKDVDEWYYWDDFYVDYEALQKDKAFCRKFCKTCKDLVDKKVNFGRRGLGNFPWDDSYAQSELLADEFDAKKGDTYHFLTSDGDNGEFFYIEEPKNATAAKAVKEIMDLTIGVGDWSWETVTC